MFTHLRQSAQGIFAKLILIFLACMFVLWGIGDTLRGLGGKSTDVATVGKVTITGPQFHSVVQRTHERPEQVLAGLINDALIAQEENALGIVVSDDQVADFIASMPEFHGKDGRFDKAVYQTTLANAEKNEADFVTDIRREIGAKLLIGTFADAIPVPESMVQALYRLQEEQRTANLIYIPAAAVASLVAAPSEQEIKAYYDAHPKEFGVPEYRTLSYVTLPLDDVQSKISVTPDEIKRVYQERREDFRQPERRQVEEMQFDNEQDAKAAAARLAKGTRFSEVVASAPIVNKAKTSLGLIAQQDIRPDVAEQIFALKPEESTAPIFADLRWHIYHVSKIVAEHESTFEEAQPGIVSDITARQSQDTAQKMINGLEDALAGGATLESAAEKVGEKVRTIGPLAHDGSLEDGKKADLPPYPNFLSVAFATAQKDHSQAVQAADGSYFIVRVDSVSPEHIRPLGEVKAQAIKAAIAQKTQEKLEQVAENISEKLRVGGNVSQVLQAAGIALRPVASGAIKRATETVPSGPLEGKPLQRGLVQELFSVKSPQGATHAYPAGDGGYVIAQLVSVTPAPEKIPATTADSIRDKLKATLTDEVLHEYLNYLRSKYPLSINAAALGIKDEAGGE